jgi:hypothetical protein
MNKLFKIILLVLLALVVVHSIAIVVVYRRNAQMATKAVRGVVIGHPRFAWNSLPPKSRAEFLSALIYDEMTFDNQTLSDCLQQLSNRTSELTGKGLSSSIWSDGDSRSCFDRRISLKFKDITLGEILKHLGNAFDATIEMNEYGIYATFGKPREKKP